jgi:hypothetical protein
VLVSLFASTLFLTSTLLFVLEPLIAKGLLPVLGGGAAVWTTAVAFFQLALFVGYLYAHLGSTWLGLRRHAWLHLGLLAAVAVALPLRAPSGWAPPPAHQALWLFGKLAVSIGPVFVLLAATAPLVQRWLASTTHPAARDPYFLYAASNAGSLAALLAYPILIEPLLGLTWQRRIWTTGLGAAVVLLAACAAGARRYGIATDAAPPAQAAPTWRDRGRWLALSAVPSSLLLSVTSYVITDLVTLPLLWVAPLALYLSTFIFAFGRRSPLSPRRAVWAQALLVLPLMVEMSLPTRSAGWVLAPAHALLFFVTALCCHQSLAQSRPAADRSTEFYLWIAAGGAIGGLFNVALAPVLFHSVVEYPLGLVAAALLRPRPADAGVSPEARTQARRRDVVLPLGLAAVLAVGALITSRIGTRYGELPGLISLGVVLAIAGIGVYSFRWRPLRFGLGLAAVLMTGLTVTTGEGLLLHSERSFYGIHKVTLSRPGTRLLRHGTTIHGAQTYTPPEARFEPLTYYHGRTGVGRCLEAWAASPLRRRVGIVGLGVGTLAAYSAPGERWTMFEIDPVVVDIARDRGLFSYLADAKADVDYVVGDARLSLQSVPDGTFGVLVLDAFSSDAVPSHLLTREAMSLYVSKLAPSGVIAIHLSSRHLDLEPVMASAVESLGLTSRVLMDEPVPPAEQAWKWAADWMVVARGGADLAPLAADKHVRPPRARRDAGWTDDYSTLWRVLKLLH